MLKGALLLTTFMGEASFVMRGNYRRIRGPQISGQPAVAAVLHKEGQEVARVFMR